MPLVQGPESHVSARKVDETNETAFGRPGNSRGHDKSSFPQVRMACLIEVGTHLVLDAEVAGCRTGEVTLVGRLPRSCGPGELVLADREFLRCGSVVAGARQPDPARQADAPSTRTPTAPARRRPGEHGR
jgi:hypothetical protein